MPALRTLRGASLRARRFTRRAILPIYLKYGRRQPVMPERVDRLRPAKTGAIRLPRARLEGPRRRGSAGRLLGVQALMGAAAPIAFLVLLSGVTTGTPRLVENPTAADLHLREEGWVIDGILLRGTDKPGIRRLLVTGRIAAPAWVVWNVVHDSDRSDGNWPSIKESIVERAEAETTITRCRMAIPIYKDRRYRIRIVSDPARMRLLFDLVPGYGNVREIRGHWTVTPLGGAVSHLTYVLDTDPGVRLVPRFIVDWATRNAIPRLFASVRERSLARIAQSAVIPRSAAGRGAAIDREKTSDRPRTDVEQD
jgi:hypothetical protein